MGHAAKRLGHAGIGGLALLLAGCAVSHPPLMVPVVPASEAKREAAIDARRAQSAAFSAQAAAIASQAAASSRVTEASQILASAVTAEARVGAKADLSAAQIESASAEDLANTAASLSARLDAVATSAEAAAIVAIGVTLDDVLRAARKMQAKYEMLYDDAGTAEDLLQLPLIGLAAWAADTALGGTKTNAVAGDVAREIAQIGILAGAFSAGRGALMPTGLAKIYADGHLGMGCVVATGAGFTAADAVAQHQNFKMVRTDLAQSIGEVEKFSSAIPAARRPEFEAQIRLANSELERARETDLAAGLQTAAWNRKEGDFEAAAGAVAHAVVTRALVRAAVNYDALLAQFKGPPATPAPAEKPVDPSALSAAEVTVIADSKEAGNALMKLVDTLVARRGGLKTVTPDYVARIGGLATCVTKAAATLPPA